MVVTWLRGFRGRRLSVRVRGVVMWGILGVVVVFLNRVVFV